MKGKYIPLHALNDLLTNISLIAILQRVLSASVTVDKQLVSSIGRGILVFAAVSPEDTQKSVETMASRLLKMKMWPDESGAHVNRPSPQNVSNN